MNNMVKSINFILLLMILLVPFIGCDEDSNGGYRKANGCRQVNIDDTGVDTGVDTSADTNTNMNTDGDSDYSKFVGSFKLVGISFVTGGNTINAGSYLGQPGVDWYGDATVTADGHVEGEFVMPSMAADIAGPFSYDILEVTEDSIRVSSAECQTGSDWVKYSVNGEEISATVEIANFCKTSSGGRPGASIFHFVKTAEGETDNSPDIYSDYNTGSASPMELKVDSPVAVTSGCMIHTLIHFH